MANEGVSPVPTVFDVVRAAHLSRLPPDAASNSPKCVTVPHDPEAVGNVIAAAFDVEPVAADVQSAAAVVTRAYEPPDTSVPAAVSDGAAVNSPTLAVTAAKVALPVRWSRTLFSA